MPMIFKWLCATTTIILTALFIVMLVIVNANASTRYLMSFSLPWTEELTRYCMIWMVMLGAAVLALFDDHIALNLPNHNWPEPLRHVQKILIHMIVVAVSLVVVWTGFHFALGMSDVVAPALQIPMSVPTLAVPVGASLIALASIVVLYNDIAAPFGLRSISLPLQKAIMDGSFKHVGEDGASGAAKKNDQANGN